MEHRIAGVFHRNGTLSPTAASSARDRTCCIPVIASRRGESSGEKQQGGQQSGRSIPQVSPSFIIPPPNRGSQYDLNSSHGGVDDPWGGINNGGGGGSRGGAFNLFNGGFFGRGGKANLFERLRMMALFVAWCGCMYAVIASVFRLTRLAVLGITVPKWDQANSGSVGFGETALMTEDVEESDGGILTSSGSLASAAAVSSPLSPSSAATGGMGSDTAASSTSSNASAASGSGAGTGLEDLGIEAGTVDERQRAYLELLDRHSIASKSGAAATVREAGNAADADLGVGSHTANSAAIYLMMMGCVAFFFIVS